jgi:hypothetical protein
MKDLCLCAIVLVTAYSAFVTTDKFTYIQLGGELNNCQLLLLLAISGMSPSVQLTLRG